MRFGGGAVDHLDAVAFEADQCGEQLSPDPAARPAMKAIVDRRRRTVDRRAILPTTAALEHVDDAADDPAIVLAMRPRLVFRQQRRDRRPLPIVEPKLPPHDPSSQSFQLESRLFVHVNILIEF
jgi:hypothetical protein